jgi:hypothetical protein
MAWKSHIKRNFYKMYSFEDRGEGETIHKDTSFTDVWHTPQSQLSASVLI